MKYMAINSLEKLKKKIFFGEHSDEEWKRIKLQVEKEMLKATDEEYKNKMRRQEFIECGAGPLLEQVLEYMEKVK